MERSCAAVGRTAGKQAATMATAARASRASLRGGVVTVFSSFSSATGLTRRGAAVEGHRRGAHRGTCRYRCSKLPPDAAPQPAVRTPWRLR